MDVLPTYPRQWVVGKDHVCVGKKGREKAGRDSSPSYGIIDSQSVKTIAASEERGTRHRRRKKTKGRKRHIVVDIMGNMLAVVVHAANIHDTKSGILPARKAYKKYPTIKKFCGDEGYRKSFEEAVLEEFGLEVDISANLPEVCDNPQTLGRRAHFRLVGQLQKAF